MKKGILLIIMLLLVTGCSTTYEVNFDNNAIRERIIGKFDENIYEAAKGLDGDGYYLEEEVINKTIPAFKDYSDYYKININNVTNNSTQVELTYNYTYDNFNKSYLVNNCFEKYYVLNDDKYFSVNLSGDFYCFKNSDITVKAKTNYKVIDTNASEVKDGYYIWHLKMNEDNEIKFQISKLEKTKKSNFLIITRIIMLILLAITGAGIYYIVKVKKVN